METIDLAVKNVKDVKDVKKEDLNNQKLLVIPEQKDVNEMEVPEIKGRIKVLTANIVKLRKILQNMDAKEALEILKGNKKRPDETSEEREARIKEHKERLQTLFKNLPINKTVQ